MRRVLHTLHRAIGASAAVLVLIVCVTGVLAVFRQEIEWLVSPAMRVEATTTDLDAITRSLGTAFPDHEVTIVHLPSGPRFAAEARLSGIGQVPLDVLVHPHTGTVQAVRATDVVCFSTSDCLRQIHVRLLMGHTGRLFVGLIGVLLLALLATGATLHLVTRGRRPKKRKLASRAPMRLHRALGILSLPFSLLIAMTGAVLGLDAWLPDWTENVPRVVVPSARSSDIASHLEQIHVALASRGIDATLEQVEPPTRGDSDFSFAFTEASFFAGRGELRVHVDPASPGRIAIDRGARADLATRAYSLLDPLHFGSLARGRGHTLDFTVRGAWALLGLAMVAVTLSGMVIVIARLRAPRKAKQLAGEPSYPSFGLPR